MSLIRHRSPRGSPITSRSGSSRARKAAAKDLDHEQRPGGEQVADGQPYAQGPDLAGGDSGVARREEQDVAKSGNGEKYSGGPKPEADPVDWLPPVREIVDLLGTDARHDEGGAGEYGGRQRGQRPEVWLRTRGPPCLRRLFANGRARR